MMFAAKIAQLDQILISQLLIRQISKISKISVFKIQRGN